MTIDDLPEWAANAIAKLRHYREAELVAPIPDGPPLHVFEERLIGGWTSIHAECVPRMNSLDDNEKTLVIMDAVFAAIGAYRVRSVRPTIKALSDVNEKLAQALGTVIELIDARDLLISRSFVDDGLPELEDIVSVLLRPHSKIGDIKEVFNILKTELLDATVAADPATWIPTSSNKHTLSHPPGERWEGEAPGEYSQDQLRAFIYFFDFAPRGRFRNNRPLPAGAVAALADPLLDLGVSISYSMVRSARRKMKDLASEAPRTIVWRPPYLRIL